MSSILAKMAVNISANTAEFDKALSKTSKGVKAFSVESELAGTRVGSLASKISSFANPVTATIGVLGGLAAAYASSTIGAKDLEFAHKQLAAATTILSNEFASLFSGVEDGEGFVSKLVKAFLSLSPALAAQADALAKAGEALEDLQRDEKLARGEVSLLLGDNIEKMTILQESQVKYNEKVHIVTEILDNINKAQDMLIGGSEKLVKNGTLLTKEELKVAGVLTRQLQAKQQQLNADTQNEKLLDERASIILEIRTIEKERIRDREKAQRIESNLLDVERKRLGVVKEIKTVQATPSPSSSRGVSASGQLVSSEALTGQVNASIENLQRLPTAYQSVANEMIDISGLVAGGIAEIADAFGQAFTGSVNFGDAILKSLASFAQQFGALLIATGIGKIAFDKFKSGPAMIAAGAALVALGGAVKGAIANRPNLGGGGGSSGSFGGALTPNSLFFENGARQSIFLEARGASLVAVTNEQGRRDNRIRANSRRLS